ncbi:hypothetical protein PG997_010739 [Apiospora hydei]|uniref:Uncharacterized protein n=1 Tax=Apiospora hydei TaxID=1337664 RepID=A0ABR1VJR2_9PEZI
MAVQDFLEDVDAIPSDKGCAHSLIQECLEDMIELREWLSCGISPTNFFHIFCRKMKETESRKRPNNWHLDPLLPFSNGNRNSSFT